ncbi:type II and III secretion system protein family protein [Ramlibacter sp.]|uniref:type II and III secretion system protein family protein n=1 Tax=Ramlibacter sp. TaxID=1917967 RepID=UPI002C8BE8EF|nr:type II and III secretion system protein family protein [Ramlibacter sp.]HWI81812.1 type II and III secretion system protein family protein [Ramlibacter sp.]
MKNPPSGRAALCAAVLLALATSAAPAAAQSGPTAAASSPGPAASQPARQARTGPARGATGSSLAGAPPGQPAGRPCTSVSVDPPTYLTLGKSRVVRLEAPAARLVVGGQSASRAGMPLPVNPEQAGAAPRGSAGAAAAARGTAHDGVADTEITLLSPHELFLLGRRTGSMNVVVQSTDGRCVVKDIVVAIDPDTLQAKLAELMPEETAVKVRGADTSLVLTGMVSDSVKLDQVLTVANSYADSKKVVNLLRVTAPQQVMLEVKIAEVSKSLLDRLGLDFSRAFTTGAGVTNVISGIIGGGLSVLSHSHGLPPGAAGTSSNTTLGIDANKKDGVVRILAEPNIVAISGQSASFLSGGKIFIPVAQDRNGGGTTITLEEKEFGVGLKFTPTVLDGRVNLKILSEVSELSQTGTPFTAIGGAVAILPSMATRKVDTTVQLADGQSFAVAGLIKNNFTEALNKFPGLGEAPVLGALFRSSEFQSDQTELMFVVTPRLVKPFMAPVALPTDNHVTPSRSDVMLMGTGEGQPLPQAPAVIAPAPAVAPAPATR